MHKVFIDGQAGTTGLEIAGRIKSRGDVELLEIPEAERKDPASRRPYFEAADLTILCLPDEAAREAVALAPSSRVLDASTAHRTAEGWVYGLPELEGETTRDAIRDARRVSNPGCYPTGFVLLVRPLIDAGIVSPELPLRVNAVSGYSGGGKAMIAEYSARDEADLRVRPYGLNLSHKHVPEMRRYTGTRRAPLFQPMVGHFYKGMLTQVPLFLDELGNGANESDVYDALAQRYVSEPFVRVMPPGAECAQDAGFLGATACNDTNRIELMVFAGPEHVLLSARYDNLGKGAAGAAVQNMNLMLGVEETTGLTA
ncbi:MAG: N-acetyl-gamma-glutamyl-phosphate reductase [Gammaproteobacteria bacterium]|nr:N-acetyl-gamma-glutamyl-phosphate reductase [Gammaproteobacteria bacterium]